jgi:hypothetical protein
MVRIQQRLKAIVMEQRFVCIDDHAPIVVHVL